MPRRMILTDAERQTLLALPTDDDTLIRHWSLDDDDHRLLETRRRDDTRLGLALQLCALRYPGRLIQRGEVIPESALAFLAEQLSIDPEALANFARRTPTRYEQLAVLRQHYGFSELSHPLRADLVAFARGVSRQTAQLGAALMHDLNLGAPPPAAAAAVDRSRAADLADKAMTNPPPPVGWRSVSIGKGGAMRVPMAAPSPTKPKQPNAAQVELLRKQPELAPEFDKKFGTGTAQQFIKAPQEGSPAIRTLPDGSVEALYPDGWIEVRHPDGSIDGRPSQ